MVKNIWINKIYSITMPKMHKIMSFIAIICVSFVRICHIAYLSCINLASLEKAILFRMAVKSKKTPDNLRIAGI